MKRLFEMLQHWRGYFVHLLEWSFCIKPLKKCTFFNSHASEPAHRFEIIHQRRYYCVFLFEWSLGCLNAYKFLKPRVPVNTLAGYKFIFGQLPSRWTDPSEITIWNITLVQMRFCTLIQLILFNSERIQTPENSRPSNHHSWIQVYILTTPKGMDKIIWNLNLKYLTNKYDMLYTYWNDPFEL